MSRPRPARSEVRWWFRPAAVIVGLLPLLLLELCCRLTGLGTTNRHPDLLAGFNPSRPLFVTSEDGLAKEIAASRTNFFRYDSFPVPKPRGQFRIFVFGGSTVQGHPFSTETSFAHFLEMILQRIAPEQSWDVVNCGGVSYASFRLIPIARECVAYEPDLFIFCEGHNEFLEDVSYSHLQASSFATGPLQNAAESLSAFRAFRDLLQSGTSTKHQHQALPDEVQTRLDQVNGLRSFHRDDQHAQAVTEHFRQNLLQLNHICRTNGIPLLVIEPPANLRDCPPFKSEFSQGIQPTEIQHLLVQARACAAANPVEALRLAERAVSTDSRYALSWYELGHIQLTAGLFDDAYSSFQRALDEDVCPLRMTSALREAMHSVVTSETIQFINSQQLLENQSRHRLIGDNILVDHVHPSFRGHEEIALAITRWMIDHRIASVNRTEWEDVAREICRTSVQDLPDTYFLQGRRRLDVLKRWAAGRSLEPEMSPAESPLLDAKPLPSESSGETVHHRRTE